MTSSPRFQLGNLLATPGAMELMERKSILAGDLLLRHRSGDWGDLCHQDKAANDSAVAHGERILSSYKFGSDKLWVITEWDRSATTILLPEEY